MNPVIDKYGTKRWYSNNKLHRINGPAIKYKDGRSCWCVNDELHRINGSAIENLDGIEWFYFYGIHYSNLEYQQIMYFYNLYRQIIQEIKM